MDFDTLALKSMDRIEMAKRVDVNIMVNISDRQHPDSSADI